MMGQSLYNEFLHCRDQMVDSFAPHELRELCDTMGTAASELPHETPKELVTALLRWASHRGLQRDLLALLRRERPNCDWPGMYSPNSYDNRGILGSSAFDMAVDEVPVVVIAMTRDQAESLVPRMDLDTQYAVLSSYKTYTGYGTDEWVSHYHEKPADWVPFFRFQEGEQLTIRRIVEDIIQEVNESYEKDVDLKLVPRFVSSNFLGKDLRGQTVDLLEQRGGILIIDPLSLQHTELMDTLLQSALLANSSVATIVINPLDQSSIDVHTHVQQMIEAKLWRFHKRYYGSLELECEYGGEDMTNLRRWLYHRLLGIKRSRRNSTMSPNAASKFYTQTNVKQNTDGHQLGDVFRRSAR